MGRPLLARFAIVSFIGFSALVVACAQTEEPDLLGPMTETNKTEPEADAGKKLPPKTQEITKPKPVAVKDAGAPPVVDAAPPPEPEEPEEEEAAECDPGNDMYLILAAAAIASPSMKPCMGGPSECDPGGAECCYANAVCLPVLP